MSRRAMQRNALLEAYGSRIGRWPSGRLNGWLGLLRSTEFRKRRRQEAKLDGLVKAAYQDATNGAPERLLALMGVRSAEPPTFRFGPGFAAIAAASLCLGLAIGSLSSDGLLGGEGGFAGLSDAVWFDVTGESAFQEDVG